MAIKSSRPSLKTVRKIIKTSLQAFLSKSYLRALEILLQPCCDLSATAIAECGVDGYTVTITLDRDLSLMNRGVGLLVTGDFSDFQNFTDGNTIVFTNVQQEPGTKGFLLTLFLPITDGQLEGIPPAEYFSNLSPSVAVFTVGSGVVFPTC